MTDDKFIRAFQRDFPEIYDMCYGVDEEGVIFHRRSSEIVRFINKLYIVDLPPLFKYYHERLKDNTECEIEQTSLSRTRALEIIRDNYDLILLEML